MTKTINFKDLRLEGIVKWIHRFVMFITYPFRHFYLLLILFFTIVIIAVAIPLFNGVSFQNIPTWYGQQFGLIQPIIKSKIKALPKKIKTAKFKKEIKLKHASFEPKPVQAEKAVQDKAPEQKKYATWNIKNKVVVKKPEIKTTADISEKNEGQPVQTNPIAEKNSFAQTEKTAPLKKVIPVQTQQEVPLNEIAPVQTDKTTQNEHEDLPELKYQKRDDLDLIYLQKPKYISGQAITYGANELYVDGTYLYLYGIYTHPMIYDETQAREYLRKLVADKKTDCYVVAETKDGIATAICFADEKNINESMVNAYLADNIAL